MEIGPRIHTSGPLHYEPLTDEYTRVINGTEYTFWRYQEDDGSIFIGVDGPRGRYHSFVGIKGN